MTTGSRKPLPGDAADPQGLTALLERYLLWMETHHYAAGTVTVRRLTQGKFLLWCHDRSIAKAARRDARDAGALSAASVLLSQTKRPTAWRLKSVALAPARFAAGSLGWPARG